MKIIRLKYRKYYKAINDLIKKEARSEAKKIIELTTDEYRNEFLSYYSVDNGNIACLVLDKAKDELVKENILNQNKNDHFGGIFDI